MVTGCNVYIPDASRQLLDIQGVLQGKASNDGLPTCELSQKTVSFMRQFAAWPGMFGLQQPATEVPIYVYEVLKVMQEWEEGDGEYVAPELLRGCGPSPAADIYSLGATVYECLTGELSR